MKLTHLLSISRRPETNVADLAYNIFKEMTDHAKLINQSRRTDPVLTKPNICWDIMKVAIEPDPIIAHSE